MKNINRTFFLFCLALLLSSCGGQDGIVYDTVYYQPEYAHGFDIVGIRGHESRIIRVMAPWQGADSTALELFISKNGELPPRSFAGQVIEGNASKLAVMSSSYIGLLDRLGASDKVVAVSGLDYVSSPTVQSRRDSIAEIGSDADPDYEALVSSAADIVLLYGIVAASLMEKKLNSLGIPYIYMGEYLESTPLGRAEWMVAIAEILGIGEDGQKVFSEISEKYNAMKELASSEQDRPKVMLNAPYGDTWFMASSNGVMANFIHDAGGEYVYKENPTNKSLPVDREKAFHLASEADFWLDLGQISSLQELYSAIPGFSSVGCVKAGRVYNNDARMTPGGGNEFWESAPAMPEVLLSDLIKILHPGLLPESDTLYYYRKLL